ncbi:MAG: hypothetical protein H3C68_05695 [Deltaproteobacteria bacterium]|nr:hypothetical protein [Deltaproteobacteria bacterium]MBZ0220221.1 hypothetical protein [Deltaproteobacteria bacterium]
MKRRITFVAALLTFGITAPAIAAETGEARSGIQGMSDEEIINIAQSAAPPHISGEATILVPAPDGKLRTVREGTNEFTCIADLSGQETPDPVCADRAGTEWFMSFFNNEPRPANTEPGIAYMAQGGWHWERDGEIVMGPAEGATRVKEPPHWMLLWPIEAGQAGLPENPNRFGTYVMYEGSPFAHLMVYQDPKTLPAG